MASDHLPPGVFDLVRDGHLPATALARLAHEHLLEVCPHCAMEWSVHQDQGGSLPLPPVESWAPPTEALPREDDHVSYRSLGERLERQDRRRRQARLARRHLAVLLAVAPEERATVVARARSRYRSRAFAELLIEESRRTVRIDPEEAENLADLVQVVLQWLPGAGEAAWARELELRARAWKANAQRVRGDLRAARSTFAGIRSAMLDLTVSTATAAELSSLEASILAGQRRWEDARRLLEEALGLHQVAGDRQGEGRTRLKLANLCLEVSDPEKSLSHARLAVRLLDDLHAREPLLSFAVLNLKVLALCELGQVREAEGLLSGYSSPEAVVSYTGPMLRALRARLLWKQGRLDGARRLLAEAQQGFLQANRTYDAILVSLDLAQVHLEAGRLDELHDLAADLVVQFRARGVARETLAALRLLAQAAAAREVSRDLLDHVRGLLKPRRSPVRRGKPL